MSSIILFDIDKTLVSTNHIRLYEPVLIERLHLSAAQIGEIRQRYYETLEKPTDFSPQEYFLFLASQAQPGGGPTSVDQISPAGVSSQVSQLAQELLDKYLTSEFFAPCLYPDVVRNLERLSAESSLGVFSEGHEFFQKKKLELTGIIDYFDDKYIYISRRKSRPEYIEQLPASAKVIDDRPEFLEAVATRSDLEPILIRRVSAEAESVPGLSPEASQAFSVISSFDEIA